MDAKLLLDQILQSGKGYAEQGRDIAESKLGVPAEGGERDAMLSGMGKGAMAAGALALLLGTRSGRKLGGTALKLGSLAAVGGVAYKAFQNWQAGQGEQQQVVAIDQLEPTQADSRSLVLLRAMVAAAKADGHIDEDELGRIKEEMEKLGLDESAVAFFREEARKPLNVAEVAAGADNAETASEIYLVSRLVIDADNDAEKAYLNSLVEALQLDAGLVAELESSVA